MDVEIRKKIKAEKIEVECPYCFSDIIIYIQPVPNTSDYNLYIESGAILVSDRDLECSRCHSIFEIEVKLDGNNKS